MMIIDNNDSWVGEYENLIILKLHWNVSWVFSEFEYFLIVSVFAVVENEFRFSTFFHWKRLYRIAHRRQQYRRNLSGCHGHLDRDNWMYLQRYNAKMYWINYR